VTMTKPVPCPPAPGPLEEYAARFDDLFTRVAQRRGFREYLAGLLAPRDRNKTLTALAGAEPVAGAQHPAVQRLQFFLSESRWDADQVNARRLELLLADPATAPHEAGVLVIDDSGDRKDGVKTAHVGHQWLGRYGKTDNGVVTVTTVRADERVYYPVHAVPYTPAKHFAKGKSDPGFRTRLAIGADLAVRVRAAGFTFRAVAADSAYGDQDGFRAELSGAGLPFVMALKPRRGVWAYGPDAHTPVDAARALARDGPDDPGDWTPVTRGTRRPGGPPTPPWAGGGRTAPGGWWRPPPTRAPCRARRPGTWSPTCPAPAARARQTARTRPRAWPRSRGSTGSGTGSSRAASRSRTSWAGPTSRSAPMPRSAATRCWSTARSASAGPPGSLITRRSTAIRHRSLGPVPERGGPCAAGPRPAPSWPRALRAVRAWLSPWTALQRWRAAWSKAPPPPQLQALINSVAAGCGLHLYIRN
jgi:hypothetical protein